MASPRNWGLAGALEKRSFALILSSGTSQTPWLLTLGRARGPLEKTRLRRACSRITFRLLASLELCSHVFLSWSSSLHCPDQPWHCQHLLSSLGKRGVGDGGQKVPTKIASGHVIVSANKIIIAPLRSANLEAVSRRSPTH